MIDFEYQALNSQGEPTSGRIAADSAAAAILELEEQGLAVQSLRQVEIAKPAEKSLPSPAGQVCERALLERVGQILARSEELALALTAFAAEMPAGRPRREVRKLAALLSDGATAEQLVHSSSVSTLLPLLGNDAMQGAHGSLHNLLAESTARNRTRVERVRGFSYPLIVFMVAIVVLIFLGVAVIPTFTDIYNDFAIELPTLTKGVVIFSNELMFHPVRLLTLLAAVIAVVYLALFALSTWGLPGRLLGDLTSGNSSQVSAYAVFTRTLAEALEAGFSLTCALSLAGQGCKLGSLRGEAVALAKSADAEGRLSEKAIDQARLPETVTYALRAGPTGEPSLPLLRELSELYSERVRNRFNWGTGFIPHLTILIVGIVVGGVVLALYLPLVQLINGLTG